MKVEVIRDAIVSTSDDLACAYPLTALAADGSIVCMYRRGQEKHSYDGVLVSQRSTDLGQTWSPATVVFDGLGLDPPRSTGSGGLCLCGDGSLFAVFSATEVTRPDAYVFSEEGETQHSFEITARSTDHGVSWEPCRYLDEDVLKRELGPTSNPIFLADGTLFVPGERKHELGHLGTGASFSRDHGQTLGPVEDLMVDPTGKLNYCDGRFTTFADGEVLCLLWTFRQDTEETVDVHRSVSSDHGKSWSPPQPVGHLGQITDPLVVDGDTVLAVSNYRWPPDGSRLWISRDRGVTWPAEESVQMWDVRRERMVAEPTSSADSVSKDSVSKDDAANDGVWHALPGFTFGTPNLKRLPDGSFFLSYYAETTGKPAVRACRFNVSFP